MSLTSKLNDTYHRLASYKYDKKKFSGNLHSKSIRALSTFDEILILYSRFNRNLARYRTGYLKARRNGEEYDGSKTFTYIRTDYNSLILVIHRYLFFLIKVVDYFPNELKQGVKTNGLSDFYKTIEKETSPLHQFFISVHTELGMLEYQLAVYRDLYLEHNDRVSTDWKTIYPYGKEYYIRHIPSRMLSKEEYEKLKVRLNEVFGKEVFYVLESMRVFTDKLIDLIEEV